MGVIEQVAAIGAVLGLLGACLWWLRRRGFAVPVIVRRGDSRRLQSLERLPLGAQHTLHLVRLGDQALVVGCSPAGCTLLATRAWRQIDAAREVLP